MLDQQQPGPAIAGKLIASASLPRPAHQDDIHGGTVGSQGFMDVSEM